MTIDFDMKAAFPRAIEKIGDKDENIVVVVGDIGHFALQGYAKKSKDRYYNLGILEPTLVSACAGLAKEGFYPIGHTIAPFIAERSLEQIKLDFCYQNLGGTLITVGSAFDYATLGCTHHCYVDLGIVSSYPGTEVCYPSSPIELECLLEQTYNSGKLTYIRMARTSHCLDIGEIKLGKNIVVKKGDDITLVACGPQLKTIVNVAKVLENSGLSAEVIYCHTVKPFDEETIVRSARKTKRVFTIEEHVYNGGLSSLVLKSCRKIDNVVCDYHCIPDKFIRNYGTVEEIREGLGFNENNIVKKVRELIK